jgi:DNA-binding NtrC family response regulator
MQASILIVDDERDLLQLLKRSLAPELKCQVETASSAEMALQRLAHGRFDLILADIRMPGMDGLELLHLIKSDHPLQTIVMMTAYGQIDLAVEAMRSGAYDFITKPFEHDALVLRLKKALERSHLIRENQRLQTQCRGDFGIDEIVGKGPVIQRVFDTIRMVAKTDHTVLITGESGTGKELTARAVHNLSPRSQGPYVAVNCPTIPENILESELFGYKKGAFTHAVQNKIGLFQEAHGGTIFLDEIGDISTAIQTKLLRVLQEKEIKPLGDTRAVKVDVRIIASTNRDLQAKIQAHTFREDVYYRLNVLPIHLPPLRERPEDIPLLAAHFMRKHCQELNRPGKRLSAELMLILQKKEWIGNIRELENLIIQGILFSSGDAILPADVGFQDETPRPAVCLEQMRDLPYKEAKENFLRRFNHSYLGDLLTRTQGNITQAARQSGLERQALQQILRRYAIPADKYRA